jgi:HEAT repeat protein
LAELEQTVNRLTRDAEYLMDRGQLPMATNKLHELIARFTDAALSDRERLRALGLLRRNRALTDNVVQHATSWLQTAQEERTRRELLQQLDGATNAALKQPLLNLAAKETSSDVRQEVVENLRNFIDDPQVENLLWSLLKNDPDEDVREEAEDALREGPLSPARLESLRQRALNAEAPIEERLVALRALSRARADVSEVVGIMAERAQRTTDSAERVRLFDAFDGLRNPALAPALVQGLQDPNPVVREKAADALSDFAKDPGVQQWLRHVSENDADQRVRREAFRALGKRLD